jgi:hypothetical protein
MRGWVALVLMGDHLAYVGWSGGGTRCGTKKSGMTCYLL